MSEIPLLLVTSFNEKLYKCTGYRLLKTHRLHKINVPLLITYEDMEQKDIISHPDFLYYNLQQDEMLRQWLHSYSHLIPKQLGGSASDCNCKLQNEKDEWNKHQQGCPHSQWNRRASQWFRKVVSLNYALTLNPQRIVFLDCDVIFLRSIPPKVWNATFNNCGLIYHQGKWRTRIGNGIESGIIGFSQKGGGFDYLCNVIKCFTSGEFQQYRRWDDGYIFRMILEKTPISKLTRRDLVTIERKTSHVVNLGCLRDYIRHDKGHHLRIHKIV